MGNISNHADDVLGDLFVRSGEFSLLSGGNICVLDGRLFREVLTYGDGAVFKIVSLGEDP